MTPRIILSCKHLRKIFAVLRINLADEEKKSCIYFKSQTLNKDGWMDSSLKVRLHKTAVPKSQTCYPAQKGELLFSVYPGIDPTTYQSQGGHSTTTPTSCWLNNEISSPLQLYTLMNSAYLNEPATVAYRQQMTALQDNAKSRKAWRRSKDSAYFNVWPSMISASSFSFLRESPRDEQWAVSVARVACTETKTQKNSLKKTFFPTSFLYFDRHLIKRVNVDESGNAVIL